MYFGAPEVVRKAKDELPEPTSVTVPNQEPPLPLGVVMTERPVSRQALEEDSQ